MAALSITAANVLLVSGPVDADQKAGEAFAAGAMLYLASDNTWKKAKCGGTTDEAGANGLGMALATADAAGARISVARPGAVVQIGAGTTGVAYYVGATAGALNPVADLVATNKVTPAVLGIGQSPARVQLLGSNYNAGSIL